MDNSIDSAARVIINKYMMDAHLEVSIAGKDGAAEALELYNKALTESKKLSVPADDDFVKRRQIYRNLGFCTYLLVQGDNDITALRKASEYYEQGVPFGDELNEKVVGAYVLTMANLYKYSAAAYGKKCREALERVYNEYFSKFTDIDHKIVLLRYLISAKCDAQCGTPDYSGAESLNKNFLVWADKKRSNSQEAEIVNAEVTEAEFRDMYSELNRLISSKRVTVPSGTSSGASSSQGKTNYVSQSSDKPWYKKWFPVSNSVMSGGGLFARILLYVAATILGFIVAGVIGVVIGIYSLIGIVIAILDFNCYI